MVSKVRIADLSTAVRRVRRHLLVALLVAGALAAAGCPDREQQITITASGIQFLTNACNRACAPGVEDPDSGVVSIPRVCQNACSLPGHLPPDFSQPTQARLFLATPADKRIRDQSKCM